MTPKEWLQLSIELIKAIAWPAVTLTGLLVFRSELKALIRRIKSGKFFGQEVSLGEELDRLESNTTAAETAVPALGANAPAGEAGARARSREEILVALSSSMPVGALVQLSARIEQQAREILVSSGRLSTHKVLSLTPMIAILRRSNAVPEQVCRSLEEFALIRNKIVHGEGVPQPEVERTVASGLRLLEVLANLPRGVHVVREVDLPLFADPGGRQPRAGVSGVRVETAQRPGSAPGVMQVFPTRKRFEVGQVVSWEWDRDQRYGETWLRDAKTGQLERAFVESAEFAGQPLEESREAA